MAVEKYGIGGTEVKTDAFEAFADIPQNRVLLTEKLTINPPVKPEVQHGITNVDQVFEHYKPQIDMTFESEEGAMRKEKLRFKGLSDFGVKGITAQSDFLGELKMKKDHYQKIIKQLKTNKLLKQALANKDTKADLVNALHALIKELDENK